MEQFNGVNHKKKVRRNLKMSNNKGITLIALVITIIVLLILAGVSIAMLTGDNGILTQGTNASADTKVAEAKEIAGLDISDQVAAFYEAKYVKNNTDAENAQAYITEKFTVSKDSSKYTIAGSKITIVPKTREGKTVIGDIQEDGTIQWSES